jgi:hypothetical protein
VCDSAAFLDCVSMQMRQLWYLAYPRQRTRLSSTVCKTCPSKTPRFTRMISAFLARSHRWTSVSLIERTRRNELKVDWRILAPTRPGQKGMDSASLIAIVRHASIVFSSRVSGNAFRTAKESSLPVDSQRNVSLSTPETLIHLSGILRSHRVPSNQFSDVSTL